MRNIVVIEGNQALEDRSWMCQHNGEAERMVSWLRDNKVKANCYTNEEWNKLNVKRND